MRTRGAGTLLLRPLEAKEALWEMNTVGRRMLFKKFKDSASDVEEPEANIQDSQIPAVEL